MCFISPNRWRRSPQARLCWGASAGRDTNFTWPTWKVLVPAVFKEFKSKRPEWSHSSENYTVYLYQRLNKRAPRYSYNFGHDAGVCPPRLFRRLCPCRRWRLVSAPPLRPTANRPWSPAKVDRSAPNGRRIILVAQ